MMVVERILFMGTAEIAVPSLAALHEAPDFTVCGVCTQPDRPSGRRRVLTASPVKQKAQELGLPVLTPDRVGSCCDALAALRPDLMVVFAYGQYLPKTVCELPSAGAINLHPSMLPKYRGASPIQSAIANGDTETGLSVIRVGEKMDAGDILLQVPVTIGPEETSAELHDRFAALSAEVIVKAARSIRDGTAVWRAQKDEEATECRKLEKEDGRMDWSMPARVLYSRVRAYQPWPGTFTELDGKGPLKILSARVEPGAGAPGEVLDVSGGGPLVACGEEALRLLRVQPPGKAAMDGRAFLNGHSVPVGCTLEG
jgi:methionyl-tRNA formyltransferase